MPSIYERVVAETEHLFATARYDDPATTTSPSTEAPAMDLATFEADVRSRVEEITARGREVLDEILPRAAQAAADAQADPLVQAIEGIVDPEARTLLASLARKLQAAATAVQAPPAAAVADPAMGEQLPPLPQVAGPVVAGQA